jgi:hypothetical protein
LIAKKNDMVPTKDILKTYNFNMPDEDVDRLDTLTAENNNEPIQIEAENSSSSDSSGFFYDIPTPGPSRSDLSLD